MSTPISYEDVKSAMADEGFATSTAGSGWNAVDMLAYPQFAASAMYNAGVPFNPIGAQYGFVYAGEMPPSIVAEVTEDNTPPYSATLAASPTSGNAPLSVTLTATESNGAGTSFAWDFGDGQTATTSVNHTTHSYTTAGSYTAKVTPTVNGTAQSQISASPVTVSTAPAYSATLAASPTSGTHPVSVTLTLTETNGSGTSFAWDFGDGNTTTTTVNNTTHSYAAAGSFTPKVTPTVGGTAKAQVSASAITIS